MSTTRLPELPAPTLYAHELLANRGGVWLACADLNVVKQAHDPGETGEEILHLMTAEQVHAYGLAVWKEAMEVAAQEAEARAAQVRAANMRGGKISAATKFVVDQLEFLASVLRSLPDPSVIQQARLGKNE